MADRKAVERTAAADDNVNLSKCSSSPQPDPNAQGESLFLPYLVEHLRSSLQQQPVPPARRRRHENRNNTHSHAQSPVHHHLETGRVEDSGTESGEDLRFLAAGLRDSIELHRQEATREQNTSQGILDEVQSALSRLQSSLQKGCLGNEHVDPSKQNSLLHLIERLQSSLQLPSAGSSWQNTQMKAGSGSHGAPESSQRFAGRRAHRRDRHTVGVTREELADVRRYLEETEMRNKMSASAVGQDKPPDVPPLPSQTRSPYDLVKQCSAGDVPFVTSNAPSSFRPFRPAHFLHKKIDESPMQYQEILGDRNGPTGSGTKVDKSSSSRKKSDYPPTDPGSKDEDEDEEEEEDDDTDFVEEEAVTSKAFQSRIPDSAKISDGNVENKNVGKPINHPNASDYDPSNKLFTPSQSVQIAVHKAAINKQLSVEDDRHQEKQDVHSETSDEGTMTDASYESETEKAESGGYEEEDKEYDDDDHEREHESVRNASKMPPGQTGIVRNLTYTIQPGGKNDPLRLQRTLDKQNSARRPDQNGSEKSRVQQNQGPNKQQQRNNYKNQQQQQEAHLKQQIQSRLSSQQSQQQRSQDQTSGGSIKNCQMSSSRSSQPQQSQETNQKYVTTSKSQQSQHGDARHQQSHRTETHHKQGHQGNHHHNPSHHQKSHQDDKFQHSFQNPLYNELSHHAGADHRNGKVNKLARKEPAGSLSNNEGLKHHPEEKGKTRQDKNNNSATIQETSNNNLETASQKKVNISAGDSSKAARFANRQLKKQKMKRANTIDIPKPLHYYDVEDDSEVSSDDGSQASQDNGVHPPRDNKLTNNPVQKSSHNPGNHANPHQHIQMNDRRGSNPQTLDKKAKKIFEEGAHDADNPKYNPQAHGGAQWNSRFANIKTCFENPSPKIQNNANNHKPVENLNKARSFWRSADDSSLKVSKNSAFHDPKLTKHGSQFLKKLHEQKDQGQPLPKLPWTATEHENVVVGSLVVPANIPKHVQPPGPQGPINKFSHAPMSAFRPIEKKDPSPTGHTPWAAPSVTGSVKQIATSKFSQPDTHPPAPVHLPKHEPPKNAVKANINLQTTPTVSSVSPTLPWTKDVSHGHNLNSTLAKFESMSSRESSPQLMPGALIRSQSQDRIPLHSNFGVFCKNVPAPPPRTYVPVPQTNIVQTRTQNLSSRHELPLIHEQTHSYALVHSKSNQYLPQGNYYSGPVKNHPLLEGNGHSSDSESEPPQSSSRLVLSTLQGNLESPISNQHMHASPVQTYSAGVTARQSVYGVARHPVITKSTSQPDERDLRPPPFHETYPVPAKSQDIPRPGDFAEEHTAAVTRVMGRPQCQAAVTVSHKTRHYNDEDQGDRGSAASHLASLLHKFSADEDTHAYSKPQHQPKPIDMDYKLSYESPKQPSSPAVSNPPKDHHDHWTPMDRPHQEFHPSPIHTAGLPPPVQTASLPPKPEGSPRLARAADTAYNRPLDPMKDSRNRPPQMYESRQVPADRFPRELPRPIDRPPQVHSSLEDIPPDMVYASRFEIPVNKVQNITMKFQATMREPSVEERKLPVSPNPGIVLRKSESWHQLAAQQQGLNTRPQSMIVSDLPPVKPRSPNAIPKAKSSHTLAFPKQFEAAIKPESLHKKQKTVEEFFKKEKSDKSSPNNSLQRQQAKARHRVHTTQSYSEKRSYSAESGVLLLDDNIDNVDEAFESLFNASSSENKSSHRSTVRIANR